jgi:cation diffusion facilitator family transporter
MNRKADDANLKLQRWMLVAAVLLFLLKLWAWHITQATSVLSDALESIVNIVAGAISLYAVYLSSLPADKNHPYGHGKVEFLSSGIEGTLIFFASLLIGYEAVLNLIQGHELRDLSQGMWVIFAAAAMNWFLGWMSIRQGQASHSPAMIASGKHLQSDTWTSLGIVIGLLLIRFTGLQWIDSLVALILSVFLAWTAYGIIRKSITGIMDEADLQWLEGLVAMLEARRRSDWVDLHNLRVIRYGSVYHIDCHLTVPWYFNVHEAHTAAEQLNDEIRAHFGAQVEMFVHTDGCLPDSCRICILKDCPLRQFPVEGRVTWTVPNIVANAKHGRENLA